MASQALTTEEQKAVDNFRNNVVAPSMEKLVILDFWAEWCGPCKQLIPVLEKVAADYADKGVVLVKVNVDEDGFIASQFQVRSIPTVYAMYQGQPVADLTQARTEAQLSAMLDQLLEKYSIQGGADAHKLDIGALTEQAEAALSAGDAMTAYQISAEILGEERENPDAIGLLLRAMVAQEEVDKAAEMLSALPDDLAKHPAIAKAGSAIEMAKNKVDPTELNALRGAVLDKPEDQEAKLNLATALMASGLTNGTQRDEAADILLSMIATDREWQDGIARKKLLECFEIIGLEDEWVAHRRRALSAILFG
ncbi:co-chaperone YbbN [Sphingorhabdus lutea]|uniref:Co-chaperone YbbN n=1 Tax=Sphingorhabdus lutea TaxID=1913578 RepID=A0A1L3J9N8_9SPHN|nr:tetratricopeptide repeat protein [Sphingorhabdus lutea]APG61839.1 co-chaperone YbbN [Sphingorhabdus lutea]